MFVSGSRDFLIVTPRAAAWSLYSDNDGMFDRRRSFGGELVPANTGSLFATAVTCTGLWQ